jgi:hypothetical protein
MVARITSTASLAKLSAYNEEKVTQGVGEFIRGRIFLQSKNCVVDQEKLHRFQRLKRIQ